MRDHNHDIDFIVIFGISGIISGMILMTILFIGTIDYDYTIEKTTALEMKYDKITGQLSQTIEWIKENSEEKIVSNDTFLIINNTSNHLSLCYIIDPGFVVVAEDGTWGYGKAMSLFQIDCPYQHFLIGTNISTERFWNLDGIYWEYCPLDNFSCPKTRYCNNFVYKYCLY